ncbi:Adenylate cyclase [Diplonema papillatum]|nr:Adenylate cyclase [Diplonema papillatum]
MLASPLGASEQGWGAVLTPTGHVTVGFARVSGVQTLQSDLGTTTVAIALRQYAEMLRSVLLECNGYESAAHEDGFMAVFSSATDAVNWAAKAQIRMLSCQPSNHDPILAHPETEPVPCGGQGDKAGEPGFGYVFRGFRVSIGLASGKPYFEKYDSGEVHYFGAPVDAAARLTSGAGGGQILLGQGVYKEIAPYLWPQDENPLATPLSVEHCGWFDLRNVAGLTSYPVQVFAAAPLQLRARMFPPVTCTALSKPVASLSALLANQSVKAGTREELSISTDDANMALALKARVKSLTTALACAESAAQDQKDRARLLVEELASAKAAHGALEAQLAERDEWARQQTAARMLKGGKRERAFLVHVSHLERELKTARKANRALQQQLEEARGPHAGAEPLASGGAARRPGGARQLWVELSPVVSHHPGDDDSPAPGDAEPVEADERGTGPLTRVTLSGLQTRVDEVYRDLIPSLFPGVEAVSVFTRQLSPHPRETNPASGGGGGGGSVLCAEVAFCGQTDCFAALQLLRRAALGGFVLDDAAEEHLTAALHAIPVAEGSRFGPSGPSFTRSLSDLLDRDLERSLLRRDDSSSSASSSSDDEALEDETPPAPTPNPPAPLRGIRTAKPEQCTSTGGGGCGPLDPGAPAAKPVPRSPRRALPVGAARSKTAAPPRQPAHSPPPRALHAARSLRVPERARSPSPASPHHAPRSDTDSPRRGAPSKLRPPGLSPRGSSAHRDAGAPKKSPRGSAAPDPEVGTEDPQPNRPVGCPPEDGAGLVVVDSPAPEEKKCNAASAVAVHCETGGVAAEGEGQRERRRRDEEKRVAFEDGAKEPEKREKRAKAGRRSKRDGAAAAAPDAAGASPMGTPESRSQAVRSAVSLKVVEAQTERMSLILAKHCRICRDYALHALRSLHDASAPNKHPANAKLPPAAQKKHKNEKYGKRLMDYTDEFDMETSERNQDSSDSSARLPELDAAGDEWVRGVKEALSSSLFRDGESPWAPVVREATRTYDTLRRFAHAASAGGGDQGGGGTARGQALRAAAADCFAAVTVSRAVQACCSVRAACVQTEAFKVFRMPQCGAAGFVKKGLPAAGAEAKGARSRRDRFGDRAAATLCLSPLLPPSSPGERIAAEAMRLLRKQQQRCREEDSARAQEGGSLPSITPEPRSLMVGRSLFLAPHGAQCPAPPAKVYF